MESNHLHWTCCQRLEDYIFRLLFNTVSCTGLHGVSEGTSGVSTDCICLGKPGLYEVGYTGGQGTFTFPFR
jgi:hypothetical protein